ncbi:ankyrin [Aspergillus taichungensis]|uniref:Ankyrin n=1 Tax=Aspergillus taichungensis TaxID=482145 RepID=A0A2J5HJP9_9EURO|nr:ankyrin [Aspergillus taichungensis]
MATFNPDAYTVGWFCVLQVEFQAARAMLDEEHNPPNTPYDDHSYVYGRMGEHNIVIVGVVVKGRASLVEAAVNMIRTFKQIRFGLKVGIAGGAVHATDPRGFPNDILLGDVVVSRPDGAHGGILQYDQGTKYPGRYEIKSHLNRPQTLLISATGKLELDHDGGRGKMQEYIDQAIMGIRKGKEYFSFPGRERDLLFKTAYHHAADSPKNCCDKCDQIHLVTGRESRMTPSVHYGLVASADTLLRDGEVRDEMRKEHEVLCFEMEAAGLANNFPCLAICGIADYADTHKNKQWQPYAAVTAAAYARDLLGVISPRVVEKSELAIKQLNDTVHRIETVLDAAQRSKILEWLSPLETPTENRNLVDSGQGLLESEVFERWINGGRWQLRLCGEAGTGKTDLCANIAKRLRRIKPPRPVIVIYLSDQPSIRKTQTPDTILGYMVRQLIQFDPKADLPPTLTNAYGSHAPRTQTLLEQILQELLANFERTYLIVDGLNQCSAEVVDVAKIYPMKLIQDGLRLSLLTTSLGYRETNAVVFCDTCPRNNIAVYFHCDCNGGNFDICLECKDAGKTCPQKHKGIEYDTVRVEVRAEDEELSLYCQSRLKHIPRLCGDLRDARVHPFPPHEPAAVDYLQDKPDLLREVAQKIASKAQGKFLLAKIWTEKLLSLPVKPKNEQQLLNELDYIPFNHLKGYCKGRVETLKLYKDEPELEVAFQTLTCVAVALRALPLLAIQHALALTSDSGDIGSLNLHPRTYILRATNGLITVDKGDVKHSFVWLLHDTLRSVFSEFEHEPRLKNANSAMASLCIDYFRHEQFDAHCESLESYPFLVYALQHWGDHVRLAALEGDETLEGKAWRLLQNRQLVAKLTRASFGLKSTGTFIHEGVGAAHLCAWFGLTRLICKVNRGNLDTHEPQHGRSPLRYACLKGHSDTVEQFLELGVAIEDETLVDSILGIPLTGAPRLDEEQKQRIKIVDILLKTKKVNINARVDRKSRTALMVAVRNGHHALVRRLLKSDAIYLDARDADDRTALSYAVYRQQPWCRSQRPLMQAEENCMLKLLLEQGSDPNTRDSTGRTVLALAVTTGNSLAARALLDAGSLNLKSEKHILHLASAAAYPEIIRYLHTALGKKTGCTPDINALDGDGLRPLHYASLSRSSRAADAVKTLLDIGADPDGVDVRGCTPYETASLADQTDVSAVFTQRAIHSSRIKPITDLPALALARNCHWASLEDLIKSGRPDVAHRDILTGDTVLHVAAAADQGDIVSLLLAQSNLHMVSKINHHSQTALYLARSPEIARILVQRGCDPEHVDYDDNTALSLARQNRLRRGLAGYLARVKQSRLANSDSDNRRAVTVGADGLPFKIVAPDVKLFSLRRVLYYFHLMVCVVVINLASL